MIYYTSDLHFGHKNCLEFDKRPFSDVAEMDSALIRNWNRKVREEDDVYIVGDFCYRCEKSALEYLDALKGHKHLVIGNHDRQTLNDEEAVKRFESIEKMQYVRDELDGSKKDIVLCHFPIACWQAMHYGSWHIYGHIHIKRDETYEFMRLRGNAFNAGCMINHYEPVTLKELVANNAAFQEMEEYSSGSRI